MPKESRVFRVNSVYSANAIVFERESFGWELTSASDLNIAMSRDTSIPHYMKLLQYENDYNEHLNRFYKYHRRARFNLKIYLILLLILVVPGFLYIIYKVYNSMKAKFYLNEAKRIAADARVVHF